MLKKTMFKSLDEFYLAIDNLIQGLKSLGNIENTNKLHSLMHQTAWTTSSELLGDLTSDIAKEIGECLEFAKHHRKTLKLN